MDTLPPARSWTRRHWLIVLVAILLAVVAYLGGIGWIAQRLQHDIGQAMRTAPVVEDHQHRSE